MEKRTVTEGPQLTEIHQENPEYMQINGHRETVRHFATLYVLVFKLLMY